LKTNKLVYIEYPPYQKLALHKNHMRHRSSTTWHTLCVLLMRKIVCKTNHLFVTLGKCKLDLIPSKFCKCCASATSSPSFPWYKLSHLYVSFWFRGTLEDCYKSYIS
jgi:hypothetical protein